MTNRNSVIQSFLENKKYHSWIFCTENILSLDFPIKNIYFDFHVCYFIFQPGFSSDKAYMKTDTG